MSHLHTIIPHFPHRINTNINPALYIMMTYSAVKTNRLIMHRIHNLRRIFYMQVNLTKTKPFGLIINNIRIYR